MEILKELDDSARELLLDKHLKIDRNRCNFESHFAKVINHIHCYQINIMASDYSKIRIQSCIDGVQSIADGVNLILSHPEFLENSMKQCLDGNQVRQYLNKLSEQRDNLHDTFLSLDSGDSFLLDRNGIEVTDGMHRLVAYGLATNMQDVYFPIPAYLGTNKTKEEIQVL